MGTYAILGWVSVALAIIATSPWWLRMGYGLISKQRNKKLQEVIKKLRPVHKGAGIALAVIALIHGYLALNNNIRLHTGLLVYLSFLITALLGAVFYYKKDKHAFKGHKVMALIGFVLFAIHLIWPWALGSLFGIY